jgi:CHAD domain-containing protein
MTTEPMEITPLLTRYDVDMAHARHVANLALELFDYLKPLHGLPKSKRRLLESGALLHNVGLNIDQPLHHMVGRDIVLEENLRGYNNDEQAMLACLVAFHRKRVRPNQEPAYLSLGKKDRQIVLYLAALLRIADGLDYAGSQETTIQSCEVNNNIVLLHVAGPRAGEDAPRAQKKANLWHSITDSQLNIVTEWHGDPQPDTEQPIEADTGEGGEEGAEDAHQPAPEPDIPADDAADPGKAKISAQLAIASHDTLTDAGRRVLRDLLQKLLAHERLVRKSEHVEGVHQMRVATRRMRAVLQIIQDVAPTKAVRTFRKDLRNLAQALSPVRDCDVFLEHISSYTDGLPEEQRERLGVLTDTLQQDRVKGRSHMLAYLESKDYETFKRDFARFITGPAKGWDTTRRVRDFLGSAIWRRYEDLRAYEVGIDYERDPVEQNDVLHEARIAGKRLRYVLDMARLLPDLQVDQCIKPLAKMQDHLGALQDTAVATAYVNELNASGEARTALDAYLVSREAERAQLLADFPGHWDYVRSEEYRRNLAELLIGL